MKSGERTKRICPICGREYTAVPATSRIDNVTPICPECGARQGLESMGVKRKEQDEILAIINRYYDMKKA